MIASASGVAAYLLAVSPVMGSETWTYVMGGVLCALIGWGASRLFKWLNSLRYERLLVRGRSAKPGLTKIPPLGDRITGLETKADEHTKTLAEHGKQLLYLVTELSHNGGSSFRDKVEAAAVKAEVSAKQAVEAANRAHEAATKAAALDQKIAHHFEIDLDDA